MAPEMFGPDRLAADARPRDIYSLGCTIYEIYTGKHPSAIMHATVNGRDPILPPKNRAWSEDEVELWGYIGMCLKVVPEARPNIQLLRNALWDVRNWTTSSSAVESQPGVVAPADFERVQEWIKREVGDFLWTSFADMDFFDRCLPRSEFEDSTPPILLITHFRTWILWKPNFLQLRLPSTTL